MIGVGNRREVKQALAHQRRYEANPNLSFKETKITQDGEQTFVYLDDVDSKTGVVTKNEHPADQIVQEAVDEIIGVGNKKESLESIPFTTQYIADASLDFEQVVVDQEGQNGSKITYTYYAVDQETGQVDEQTVLETKEVENTAVEKIVRIGHVKQEVTEIAYQKEYAEDSSLIFNEQEIIEAGQHGSKTAATTYEVAEDGTLVNPVTSEPAVVQATNEIIAVGNIERIYEDETHEDPTIASQYKPKTLYRADTSGKLAFEEESVIQDAVEGYKNVVNVYMIDPVTGLPSDQPVRSQVDQLEVQDKIIEKGNVQVHQVDLNPLLLYRADDQLAFEEMTGAEEDSTVVASKITTLTYDVHAETGDLSQARVTDKKIVHQQVIRVGNKKEVKHVVNCRTLYFDDDTLAFGEEVVLQVKQDEIVRLGSMITTDVQSVQFISEGKLRSQYPNIQLSNPLQIGQIVVVGNIRYIININQTMDQSK